MLASPKNRLLRACAGICLAVVPPLMLASCGGDTLGVATTVVNVTPTNFATIPPVASTAPGTTTTLPSGAVGQESLYTVQPGDSPLAVANKYNISLTTLLAYNGWVSPAQFPYAGKQIRIPANAVVNPTTNSSTPTGGTGTGSGPAISGCGTRPAGTYTIAKGDSFYGLTQKFCVSQAALLSANGWTDTSVVLLVGKVINIPAAGN